MNPAIAHELPKLRLACYCVAFTSATVLVLCCVGLVLTVVRYQGEPQFPYEMVIGLCSAIYFFGVTRRAVQAAKLTRGVVDLPLSIRYLSHCVIGFFVPVAILAGYMSWSAFQPVY